MVKPAERGSIPSNGAAASFGRCFSVGRTDAARRDVPNSRLVERTDADNLIADCGIGSRDAQPIRLPQALESLRRRTKARPRAGQSWRMPQWTSLKIYSPAFPARRFRELSVRRSRKAFAQRVGAAREARIRSIGGILRDARHGLTRRRECEPKAIRIGRRGAAFPWFSLEACSRNLVDGLTAECPESRSMALLQIGENQGSRSRSGLPAWSSTEGNMESERYADSGLRKIFRRDGRIASACRLTQTRLLDWSRRLHLLADISRYSRILPSRNSVLPAKWRSPSTGRRARRIAGPGSA